MKSLINSKFSLILPFALTLSAFNTIGIIDFDAIDYKTVDIGGSIWMAENLNVSKFKNGEDIPFAATIKEWQKAGESGQPAWCFAENKSENGDKYGILYNWFAVNDPRGLAPEGWHIPADSEWIEMENSIGGRSVAGDKLKNSDGWNTGSKGTNDSGFSGLPGGVLRYEERVEFEQVGYSGYWWSSTGAMETKAFIRILETENSASRRFFVNQTYGLSVRCVKDK